MLADKDCEITFEHTVKHSGQNWNEEWPEKPSNHDLIIDETEYDWRGKDSDNPFAEVLFSGLMSSARTVYLRLFDLILAGKEGIFQQAAKHFFRLEIGHVKRFGKINNR